MRRNRIISLFAIRNTCTHWNNSTARQDWRREFPEFPHFQTTSDIRCRGLQNTPKKGLGLLGQIIGPLNPNKESFFGSHLLMKDFAPLS